MKNVRSGQDFANTNNSDSGSKASDEMGLADQAFAIELNEEVFFHGNSDPNSLNETLQSPKSNEKSSSSYSTSSSSLSKTAPLNSTSVQDVRKLEENKNERLSKTYP